MEPTLQNVADNGLPSLGDSAAQILRDWAALEARPQGEAGRRPQAGMVCLAVKVDLDGPGLISVAGTHRLGADLAVAATGDPGAGCFSGEALRELCLKLRETLNRPADGLAPLNLMPQRLDDADWPGHQPAVSAVLAVQGHPLELRLWKF